MIHEEICTYEVSKLAKEKGFDVPTAEFYNEDGNVGCYPRAFPHNEFPDGDYAAPTQSLLQRWLREERGIHIEIVATACGYFWIADKTNGTAITDSDVLNRGTNEGGCFHTFELCLEDALKYALENLV